MEVLFNGKLYQSHEIGLQPDNRAFCYGDGIFETIVVQRGSCPLLAYHYQRLEKGAKLLHMKLPFTLEELEAFLWQLATCCQMPLLRMRLQLWRKPGGLYTPEQQETDFIISATAFVKPPRKKISAGFARSIHLSPSAFSALKTMNALPYVLAGLEKQQRGLDEIILTDYKNRVAEAGAANLFWRKDGNWYTPSLQTGCIAGVMRAYLLDRFRARQINIEEVCLPKEQLKEADALYACNATGIWSLLELEDSVHEEQWERLAEITKLPYLF